jgi:hypothetical protein
VAEREPITGWHNWQTPRKFREFKPDQVIRTRFGQLLGRVIIISYLNPYAEILWEPDSKAKMYQSTWMLSELQFDAGFHNGLEDVFAWLEQQAP